MFDQVDLGLLGTPVAFAGDHARRLAFSGAKNFRDLGGYSATNGNTVRWKMLYRSDALHKLTDADLIQVSRLSLDRILDLRADYERNREPDRLPKTPHIRYVRIPILDSSTRLWPELGSTLKRKLYEYPATEYLVKTNIELATIFTVQVRHVLHEILAAKGRPILFHCAAGKDRTGFVAAVLLRILGVPLSTVMEDYLLSNKYYFTDKKRILPLIRLVRGERFASALKAYLEVQPAYLSAAFHAIEQEHGSFENYVRYGLDLSEVEIAHLRAVYLE